MRTCLKLDSNEVANKFQKFLLSLDQTIHSKKDSRLLMTDDCQSRLTLKTVKTADRDISSISCDPDAIFFNVDNSKLNLIYRAVYWARRTPVWSDVDFFVISNNNNKGKIKSIHTAVRQSMKIKPSFKLFPTTPRFNDWRDHVIIWWNNIVKEGYSTKMPQLYLFGASNVGKTTFISEILSKQFLLRV